MLFFNCLSNCLFKKLTIPELMALLTSNMNDIKDVTLNMEECRRMGVKVLGPDVNESFYKFAVNKKGEIRFGLGAVKGVGELKAVHYYCKRKERKWKLYFIRRFC